MAVRVVIGDALGNPIITLRKFESVEWTSTYNDVGWFALRFAVQDYPRKLFEVDRRVDIYRQPRGRAERLAFAGYMRVYGEESEQYRWSKDYSEELTVAYYGGSGQEALRVFDVGATNDERLRASVINRREGFYQDTGEDDVAILGDSCAALLYDRRPVLNYEPLNMELDYIYQAEWGVGDVMRVDFGNPNFITVAGPDLNDLLQRRIVAYRSASAEAQKNQEADDMMKAFVDENFVNATDAARNLDAALGFEIAGDQGGGPVIDYSAKFGQVLGVLQRISDTSAEEGTRVYFNVVPVLRNGRIVPRFETRVGQWGRVLDLKFGSGPYSVQQSIKGVQVLVTENAEHVRPLLEEIDD
jgi:hypothetical protein